MLKLTKSGINGTVKLTELITNARVVIGKKFIYGTRIVDILVTHTLIVKIYFLPSISKRKPNIKQLNVNDSSVLSSKPCSPKFRFIANIKKMTKSYTKHVISVMGVTLLFSSSLNILGRHLKSSLFLLLGVLFPFEFGSKKRLLLSSRPSA